METVPQAPEDGAMTNTRRIWTSLLFTMLLCTQMGAQTRATPRDGRHDFDFGFGTWKSQIKRLRHPLSGSTEWSEWSGTVVAEQIWNGRATLEEIEIDGQTGHLEGLTLRL